MKYEEKGDLVFVLERVSLCECERVAREGRGRREAENEREEEAVCVYVCRVTREGRSRREAVNEWKEEEAVNECMKSSERRKRKKRSSE